MNNNKFKIETQPPTPQAMKEDVMSLWKLPKGSSLIAPPFPQALSSLNFMLLISIAIPKPFVISFYPAFFWTL